MTNEVRPDVTDIINTVGVGALGEKMGLVITEARPGLVRGTMPVEGNTQPFGLLHGGASAVLAETLGSFAGGIHAGWESMVVGIELNVTHHRSARTGLVYGTATAITEGKTLASYDIRIVDEDGAPVCTGRLTCLIRPQRKDA